MTGRERKSRAVPAGNRRISKHGRWTWECRPRSRRWFVRCD